VQSPSEKLPPSVWRRFRGRFEQLPAADQHLVLAQVEIAPDTDRSVQLVPGFSDTGHEFMRDFAHAMAECFERKVRRRDALRFAAYRRRG